MPKVSGSSSLPPLSGNRALVLLAYTVLAVTVLAGLYWLQPVIIPLALGILFATIAAPVMKGLERCGLSRVAALATLVTLVVVIGVGLVWLIYAQTTQLLIDLPKYEKNIIAKIDATKSITHASWRENWERLVGQVTQAVKESPGDSSTSDHPDTPQPADKSAAESEPGSLAGVGGVLLALVAQTIGHVALAAVVAMFLLIDREDLRNRVIQLIGRGHITQTTKALNDAERRLGRFLLMQALINASYGVVLAISLACLQVNYAMLWGVLAAVLRYIPYVGGTTATAFPVALALAQFPSWWPAAIIVGLVIIQELIVNNFVEPRLFGNSIGVSSVALIVAAAFWTFLWGPVGLVMAGPLTVCLVVLGQYAPPLRFLGVLLGNQSDLDKEIILYQRLLAKDEIETQRIMDEAFAEANLPTVYDELVFPAAAAAGFDRESGLLSSEEERYVYDELDTIMTSNVVPSPADAPTPTRRSARLLLVAARDLGDRVVVAALKNTLVASNFEVVNASDGMLGAEIVALADEEQIDGICILSLPPGGLSHSKYLCKRLRVKAPRLKIFIGHMESLEAEREAWSAIDADVVSFSLRDLLHQLDGWKPVLESSAEETESNAARELSGPHTLGHQLVAVLPAAS